jgi:hypothetical protein
MTSLQLFDEDWMNQLPVIYGLVKQIRNTLEDRFRAVNSAFVKIDVVNVYFSDLTVKCEIKSNLGHCTRTLNEFINELIKAVLNDMESIPPRNRVLFLHDEFVPRLDKILAQTLQLCGK